MRQISQEKIESYRRYLFEEEKSKFTIEKYLRDVKSFTEWNFNREIDKTIVLSYKSYLLEHYAVASVNSILSSLNSFFTYMEWFELKAKVIKIQNQVFSSNEKELTKAEYERLLKAAKDKKNERLYLLMQTICSCGIRVSELQYITVESLQKGQSNINCKGKRRKVFLPNALCKILKKYVKNRK